MLLAMDDKSCQSAPMPPCNNALIRTVPAAPRAPITRYAISCSTQRIAQASSFANSGPDRSPIESFGPRDLSSGKRVHTSGEAQMPFLLSSDKTVVNAVHQAAWSPGKDLIACLTQDSQLHAYREFPSFQRIWALSFQSEPTSMCWRPDGIRLAVGHEDGSVSIIDAENGNTELQVR
jgi:WD40 repeat protein